jgi:hypothetical protein
MPTNFELHQRYSRWLKGGSVDVWVRVRLELSTLTNLQINKLIFYTWHLMLWLPSQSRMYFRSHSNPRFRLGLQENRWNKNLSCILQYEGLHTYVSCSPSSLIGAIYSKSDPTSVRAVSSGSRGRFVLLTVVFRSFVEIGYLTQR